MCESIDTKPKDLFSRSVLCFFNDIRAKQFIKRLEITIQNARDAKLRSKCVQLFFKNAAIRGSPLGLLRAVDLAIEHKVSLVRHMEFFCK